jgi:CCL2 lectin-like
VVPVSAPGLQVAWGRGVAITLPAGAYVWTIRETRTGYTCVLLLFFGALWAIQTKRLRVFLVSKTAG